MLLSQAVLRGLAVVRWESGCPLAPIGDGYQVEEKFTVTLMEERHLAQLDVVVRDGRPECVAIRAINSPTRVIDQENARRARAREPFEAKEELGAGPPLTGTLLRNLPLETLLKDITYERARKLGRVRREAIDPRKKLPLEPDAEGMVEVLVPLLDAEGDREEFRRAVRREPSRRGRGKTLPDSLLQEVARVYRQAPARATRKAVMEAFTLSSSGAAKRIIQARQRGFLPATKGQQVRASEKEKQ